MKTLGILGGMGPEATMRFLQRVVALTPARTDQEHIPFLVYNLPQIPDRTKALLENGASPLPAMKHAARVLEQAGADFICMPCNTAHVWYEELAAAVKVPFLNLIRAVRDRIVADLPGAGKVGLLATKGTLALRLYQDCLSEVGKEVVPPPEWTWNDLNTAIHRIKGASPAASAIQSVLDEVLAQGCEAVILGCTELSLVAEALESPLPLFDSVEILAQEAVRHALHAAS